MLSSKMSADEEEAVMKELANLQAELVSRSTRCFSCLPQYFRSGPCKRHTFARCSSFGTRH